MKKTKGTGPSAKVIMETDPRATRFLKTARDLSNKHWGEIFASAMEFLNTSHKRKRSQSASSHATSDYTAEVPEYIFVSDSD